MALKVIQIPLLQDNYGYLIFCTETGEAAVVDTPEAGPILKRLKAEKLELKKIFNTHHHLDHVGGNDAILEVYPNVDVLAYESDANRIPGITKGLRHGDRVQLGAEVFRVLFTPGHTSGHISYYNEAAKRLFCGDVLMGGGCGRLFEGTPEQMVMSLINTIGKLPRDTLCYCGHEYTEINLSFAITVEPRNVKTKVRLLETKQLRAKNIPTVPFTLEVEWQTNPFLRLDAPEVQAFARSKGAAEDCVSIFAAVRIAKDSF